MERIAERTGLVDVEYLGKEHYIACGVLEGDSGIALIDPGPTVSLPVLEEKLGKAGYGLEDVESVMLTHIHLDHSGAAGTIVKANPRARVVVHERGAKHMIDPSRLLASAGRLYGDQMDELWGEFLPVPAENVDQLSGGETVGPGGHEVDVAYTPGHAWHHVSYYDSTTGIAYVGDTAGIRIASDGFVLPVTPPPDIDLEIWEESLQRIEAWRPERLFVTHFGPGEDVADHLEQLRRRLMQWSLNVQRGMKSGAPSEDCVEEFTTWVVDDLAQHMPPDRVFLYQQGGAPDMSWHGLARYWRKKGVGKSWQASKARSAAA
jgi:glyoxylase-like metal-dependent hydrolase (beta-lactamase superfamily II)